MHFVQIKVSTRLRDLPLLHVGCARIVLGVELGGGVAYGSRGSSVGRSTGELKLVCMDQRNWGVKEC